ncbi:hypothetical protein KUL10_19930 [Glaciecola sp. KUL10]|nr:hypothetical protein KUL10_19930 [Glaciecola sp. KUL10]
MTLENMDANPNIYHSKVLVLSRSEEFGIALETNQVTDIWLTPRLWLVAALHFDRYQRLVNLDDNGCLSYH